MSAPPQPEKEAPAAAKQHGCALYNITFPPLEIDVRGLPKYPPDPSLQNGAPYALAPSAADADGVRVAVPANPAWAQQEPRHGAGHSVRGEVAGNLRRRSAKNGIHFRDYVPAAFSRRPLRVLADIPAGERLESLDMLSRVSPAAITFIRIEGTDGGLSARKTSRRAMLRALSACANTEVIVLRRMGVDRLGELSLPRLRHCDLAENGVKSVTECEGLAKRSPLVEVLNLIENPVSGKADFYSRIIGALPQLEVLNEKEISTEVRCRCFEAIHCAKDEEGATAARQPGDSGSGSTAIDAGFYRWELSVCSVPQLREMRLANAGWHPEAITKLALRDQSLTAFHVGPFVSLEVLDLHGNSIRELRGAGLERLPQLHTLDLSKNLLRLRDAISPLGLIQSLAKLALADNRFESKDWPLWAIYETRNLLGTNRSPGLSELDGRPVSVDDRVRAVEVCAPKGEGGHGPTALDLAMYRWELAIMQQVGQAQLRDQDYVQSIRTLELPALRLTFTDLSGLLRLEVLDLSDNNLELVPGLAELKALRVLLLGGNPRLKLPQTLEALAGHKSLQSVAFGLPGDEASKRHPSRKSYRKRVLGALLFRNPTLVLLDGRSITVAERASAYAAIEGTDAPDVEKYRFNLALTVSANKRPKSYNPEKVGIGEQYDPEKVTSLRSMHSAGLRSEYCNLAPFRHVVELDLSHNKLVDVLVMGLQLMQQLRALDLSFNRIETPLPRIADLLEGLPALVAVALRGNPVMKTPEDRIKLIGLLSSQSKPAPELRVIDTDITIDERARALQQYAGLTTAEVEQMRFEYALLFRVPQGDRKLLSALQVVDMRQMGLAFCDVSGAGMLRALLLRGNRFASVDSIKGLSDLRSLLVLDLRDNMLSDISSLAAALLRLPTLQSVGIGGNRFSSEGGASPRERLVRAMPPLWHTVRFPLGSLDGEDITVHEVVNAALAVDTKAASSPTRELFRFKVSLMRRVPAQSPLDSITELKLDNCGLSAVAFIEIPRLVRLSLAHNEIRADDLLHSGIDKLADLRALDLSSNKIKDKTVFKKVLGKLGSLEALWIVPNPCFPSDTPDYRRKFLSMLSSLSLRLLDSKPVTAQDQAK